MMAVQSHRRLVLRKARIAWSGLVCLLVLLFSLPTRAADAQPIELELWTWALRPKFTDYLTRLVDDFEAQHPGVRVRWIDVPGDALKRKFFAAGAARRLPDVVNLPDKEFIRMAGLGALRPLDDLLSPSELDAYVPTALAGCRLDGKLFGLPWYLSTEIRLMNVELLAGGNLTPATLGKTWDELLEQAGPFHEKTGKFLFSLRLGEIDLVSMIKAQGLEPIVPHADGGWKSNLTDPAVRALISKWVAAYRSGILPREAATGSYAELVQGYKESMVAVINANAVKRLEDTPKVLQASQIGPAIVGDSGVSNIAAVQMAVTSQSRHPREAAMLAAFVTSPKWQTELAIMASRLPSTRESLNDPAFTTPVPLNANPTPLDRLLQEATFESARQLDAARSMIPPTATWPDLERSFSEAIKPAMLDRGVSIEATLDAIDREWNRILRADAAGLPYK